MTRYMVGSLVAFCVIFAGCTVPGGGNAVREVLFAVNQASNNIKVYERTATGDQAPVRIIAGPATTLIAPHGIAVDSRGDVYIGEVANVAWNVVFKGQIDELQLWSRALTAEEILFAMAQPLLGDEVGLAAYYRMSNGSGTTLTDDSIHGWDGTLYDGCCGVPADGPIEWVPSGAFWEEIP